MKAGNFCNRLLSAARFMLGRYALSSEEETNALQLEPTLITSCYLHRYTISRGVYFTI